MLKMILRVYQKLIYTIKFIAETVCYGKSFNLLAMHTINIITPL
jgi:hypothetical protein